MKYWCRHRWSNVKRWQVGNQYFVIQRCRRCERWIRKTLELVNGKLDIMTETYRETNGAFKEAQMINPLEPVETSEIKTPEINGISGDGETSLDGVTRQKLLTSDVSHKDGSIIKPLT